MKWNEIKTVYFLGIGGIGMSNLAKYFQQHGVHVYGYDKTFSPLTVALEQQGMKIHYDDRPDLIPEHLDLVVYTPAVPKELREYQHFLKQPSLLHKRSEVLGWITAQHKNIAVAGTHGKTTTSALLTHLLVDAGKPVTAFLGGICVNYDSNYLNTGKEWMVEEADEYDRSFLQLKPTMAIIGSLDADHLDIYGSRQEMVDAYLKFTEQIPSGGTLLMSDTISREDFDHFSQKLTELEVIQFGMGAKDVRGSIQFIKDGWVHFEYISKKYHIKDLSLRLPGSHNVRNALAAIYVALQVGVEESQIRKALVQFRGIQRRFQWKLDTPSKVLIDDYAHHPEELRSAITACREVYPDRKITGIFQPHLYSRTRDFLDGFAKSLELLDQVILVEIYPAREEPIPGITSQTLFDQIQMEHKWICTKSTLLGLLAKMSLEVVMTLGAGDLDLMIDSIIDCMLDAEDSKAEM